MSDPRALRNMRLKNEYEELMQINGPIIEIEPLGHPPYEQYRVTFHIRTIISPIPTHRKETVCTLTLPPNYPTEPPQIIASQKPYPWHINWWRDGRWCFGSWNPEESLVNFLHRCARTLQFDPEIANPRSVANGDAIPFWNANKDNRRVIPCDTQVLPTLDAPHPEGPAPEPLRITIQPRQSKPKITIINRN